VGEAFKPLSDHPVHTASRRGEAEIVEIFHRIGHIKMMIGDRAKAINMFEKALEINPGHRPTLEALTRSTPPQAIGRR